MTAPKSPTTPRLTHDRPHDRPTTSRLSLWRSRRAPTTGKIVSAVGPLIRHFDRDSDPHDWQSIVDDALTAFCREKIIDATDTELAAARARTVLEIESRLRGGHHGRPVLLSERHIIRFARREMADVLRVTHPVGVAIVWAVAAVAVIAAGVAVLTGWGEAVTDFAWPEGTPVEAIARAGTDGTTVVLGCAAALVAYGVVVEALTVWRLPAYRRRRNPVLSWLGRVGLWVLWVSAAAGASVFAFRMGTFAPFLS